MLIRELKPEDDRLAVSFIYEKSWKTVYKGIIPQSFLDRIESGNWASNLDKEQMHTLVLIEDDTFIGTSSFCASRFPAFDGFGEIVSIYLLPEYMGKGFGKPLFETAVNGLRELGFTEIFLWVLEENHRARRFYEKMDFTPSGAHLDDCIDGKLIRELQYCRCFR